MPNIRLVLSIEGLIGAGKSTLLNILQEKLAKHYKVAVVPEPVEKWKQSGALEDFYQDIKGKAFEFQCYTFATRARAVQEAFKAHPEAEIFIFERNICSDRHIFYQMHKDAGNISAQQALKYEEWVAVWEEICPLQVTHFLYLDPGLTACMQRTQQRARPGEENVSASYQEHLQRQHENFFMQHLGDRKLLRLNTNVDYRYDPAIQEQVITEILEFLSQ